MELNALVPRGYTIVDTQKGDLNGDGIPDVLMLVEDSVNTSKVAGEGARRKLMILIGDQGGKYVVAATNDHIVPCATCGGIAGDPFAFIRIDDGGVFVIAMGGGSSDKWGDEATFKYSSEKKSWFAESYVNTVWEDGKDPKITKFQKAHGAAFSEFNPNDFQEKQPR
ncbi:hypothetical protein Lysil_2108 [Lysobacter silvestris]|uniref:Uncharacterized protein n=2 Tax=Solilutibacter silvestris TaxID=1645665 RepID=A0A2K1PYR3_9GAMM|nr:hypothetical protein Lysil_2108 [Lysobacter silvestris]